MGCTRYFAARRLWKPSRCGWLSLFTSSRSRKFSACFTTACGKPDTLKSMSISLRCVNKPMDCPLTSLHVIISTVRTFFRRYDDFYHKDSSAALGFVKRKGASRRIRHVDTKVHVMQPWMEPRKRILKVHRNNQQIADCFTKDTTPRVASSSSSESSCTWKDAAICRTTIMGGAEDRCQPNHCHLTWTRSRARFSSTCVWSLTRLQLDVGSSFSARVPTSSAEVRKIFINDIMEVEGVGQQEQQGDQREDEERDEVNGELEEIRSNAYSAHESWRWHRMDGDSK